MQEIARGNFLPLAGNLGQNFFLRKELMAFKSKVAFHGNPYNVWYSRRDMVQAC